MRTRLQYELGDVAMEGEQELYLHIKSLDKEKLIFLLTILDDDFKELKELIQIKIDLL
jgi:hypothetical protein